MKIDWFDFIMGIAWWIMGIIFFIKKDDIWMLIIMMVIGAIDILKSCFKDRMKKVITIENVLTAIGIIIIIALVLRMLGVY